MNEKQIQILEGMSLVGHAVLDASAAADPDFQWLLKQGFLFKTSSGGPECHISETGRAALAGR
jgi:hypothetical protein